MAELTRTPLRVVSFDFQEAFDRISPTYLSTILESYGLSEWIVDRTRTMYENARSFFQVNGHILGSISIRCSIKQGCPLSMVLCAVHQPPLKTTGPKLPWLTTKTLWTPHGCDCLRRWCQDFRDKSWKFPRNTRWVALFWKVVWAHLNVRNSKALAAGGWAGTGNDLGVEYNQSIKILGMKFSSTIGRTIHEN